MQAFSSRRFAAVIGISLLAFALLTILAREAPAAASMTWILAILLGLVTSLAIWRVQLSLILDRRLEAGLFALAILLFVLIPTPFRHATLSAWPVFLAVTVVCSGAMIARWTAPTRRQYASQGLTPPPR